jgi:eukaryotic-like serine/threonine-protein kinase
MNTIVGGQAMKRNLASVVGLGALVAACSQPLTLEWDVSLGGASQSNPLVTDKFIAVGSEVGVTIIEHDGRKRCTFNSHGEVISAPKAGGPRIFFGSSNYNFYAINRDCAVEWKFAARDRIKSDPLVDGERVFVASYDGHLYALNTEAGDIDWVFPEAGRSVDFYPDGEPPEPPSEAAGAKAQQPDSPTEPNKITLDVGDFSYSSPILHDGKIYLGNMDGRLYVLAAATGQLLWYYQTEGPLTSTPLIDGGTIFFGSNDARLHAVDIATGERLWTVTTKEWVLSSPRIDNGVVFFGGNDRRVYAVEADTGSHYWTSKVSQGWVVSSPTPYNGLLFFGAGSGDGHIYALRKDDGKVFWQYKTGGKIHSDPVVYKDKLYITSSDGKLYCFKIRKSSTT